MSAVSAASTASKRERQRLSLQVPKHTGGPVRLMTPPAPPPPDIVSSSDEETSATPPPDILASDVQVVFAANPPIEPVATNAFPSLHRALASDLLRATIVGRPRLSGPEAKSLSVALLAKMSIGPSSAIGSLISVAVYLGLGHAVDLSAVRVALEAVSKTMTVRVSRFRVDGEGWEMPVDADEGEGGERAGGNDKGGVEGRIKEVFDVEWGGGIGALVARFEVRGLEIGC